MKTNNKELEIPCDFCQEAEATSKDYRTKKKKYETPEKYLVCQSCLWLTDRQLTKLKYW